MLFSMPIYTRTGDKGETSLFGGRRIPKADPRVELYGSVDELNSWIGFFHDPRLTEVQRDLLTIGSAIAGWKTDLSFLESRVRGMEEWIDTMEPNLPKLTNFILPRGEMHIARSVCRRVERIAVREHADPVIIKYLNRLSDLLFTLARFINKKENIEEVPWSGISRTRKK